MIVSYRMIDAENISSATNADQNNFDIESDLENFSWRNIRVYSKLEKGQGAKS